MYGITGAKSFSRKNAHSGCQVPRSIVSTVVNLQKQKRRFMKRTMNARLTAICSILLLSSAVLPVAAALHPLSTLQHNTTTKISDIDITISVDWDPGTVSTSAAPRGLTKDEMEAEARKYAASIYGITNGLHRLRNVYLYKNSKSTTRADIRYFSSNGRANGSVAGWQIPNQQITMYTFYNDKKDGYQGAVMGHESGHYIYGLLDEYQDGGGKTIKELTADGILYMPSSEDDDTQLSIMKNHEIYPNWFSIADGYTGSGNLKKTAQYRIYGKSIWDTLTSDPLKDPTNTGIWWERQRFEAFNGIESVKKLTDLKATQGATLAGYDGALKIIWADEPVLNLVLLDSNMPAALWHEAQEGAGTLASNIPLDTYLQVQSGSSIGVARTKLADENSRKALVTQAVRVAQNNAVTLTASLEAAITQVKAYRAAIASPQYSVIYLLTAANQQLSAAMLNSLRANNVILKVIYREAIGVAKSTAKRSAPKTIAASTASLPDTEQLYLSQICRSTGGSFSTVLSGAQMENEAAKAAFEGDGTEVATLASSAKSSLGTGEKLELKFKLGYEDNNPEITLAAADQDFANLVPTITDPNNVVITSGTRVPGITFTRDEENSSWKFVIVPGTYGEVKGLWTATLTATAPVSNGVDIMAVTPSLLLMQIDVNQLREKGNLLEVTLKKDRPILKASVRVDIYDEKENLVRSGVLLMDDGNNGDRRPNDGIYTMALNDLQPGEYLFKVTADDNGGKAILSDSGTFFGAVKAATPDQFTGNFQRSGGATLAVVAVPPSSDGGGGCAIGNGGSRDLLLVLICIFPLLYIAVPRRRNGNR